MEKFDLKKHHEKMRAFTKKAASGMYPSPKVAKIGSFLGTGIGAVLTVAGGVGLLHGSVWGTGSLLAGLLTVVSNVVNLTRIHQHTT